MPYSKACAGSGLGVKALNAQGNQSTRAPRHIPWRACRAICAVRAAPRAAAAAS